MSGTNFFDFREKLTTRTSKSAPREPAPAPRSDAPPPAPAPPKPLTVSQLTAQIDRALKSSLPASVLVQGEVSNFNHHRGSGHFYFTLKDAEACIDCVMFRSDAARMKFKAEDGMELIASGRIAVYPARGRYQLYAATLHPLGRGALEVAFQQLHTKLKAEGLFDAERKRSIPPYPMRIALVTSRQTAALQDMLKVLRRFPFLQLCLYHVPVQGDSAGKQIAAAIHHLSATAERSKIDLMLLARGGGSLEDLWAFNEEPVARAIADSTIPIVTGIGHEVDTSIADLVADYHAHTPTEAAQIVTAHWRIAPDRLDASAARLMRVTRALLQDRKHRLAGIERHDIFRRPTDRINQLRQRIDDRQRSLVLELGHRLRRERARVERVSARLLECHPRHIVELNRQRITSIEARLRTTLSKHQQRRALVVDGLHGRLEALSPLRVLRRGYSITTHKKRGTAIRSASELKRGEKLITRFADGSVESTVDDPNQPSLFE